MLKHLKNPKNWKKGGLTYLRGSPRFKEITQLLISVYSWILCFLESALKDLQSSDKIMFKYLIKKGKKNTYSEPRQSRREARNWDSRRTRDA